MNIKRKMILGSALSIAMLSVPAYAETQVTIGIGAPLFYPAQELPYDRGYYRTYDHHYYHYEPERNGWYYGRNHEEGMREEERRKHHHPHHDNGKHKGQRD